MIAAAAADPSTPLRFGLPPTYAVAQICQLLQACEGVERVILYGSRAKGNFRPGSDIDPVRDKPRPSGRGRIA
ncbi:MAG: nucleotidyltransferase domain-containing protein, partial [Comamonas sp.]|nr:nucleotidyltransferase domain-containing protein [Comamonas sp.]